MELSSDGKQVGIWRMMFSDKLWLHSVLDMWWYEWWQRSCSLFSYFLLGQDVQMNQLWKHLLQVSVRHQLYMEEKDDSDAMVIGCSLVQILHLKQLTEQLGNMTRRLWGVTVCEVMTKELWGLCLIDVWNEIITFLLDTELFSMILYFW